MSAILQYLKDSRTELKKVVWPTKKETIKHTLIVIGVSLFVAVFLGVVDYILTYILEQFI
ncbi:MAG: preprotein translocase subunit SecE [Candidatus Komeilibacteria bacterium]|nr:preprotein translocase subunit SecE [Candidatus Komeilibacteria bacterium]